MIDAGEKRIYNIRDVAREAGVSPAAVSRVLNNRMSNVHISPKTRQLIFDTAHRLNYTPNVNAKRLFSKRAGIIGLVVPSYEKLGVHIFEENHLTRIISGLEKGLSAVGDRILLIFNDDKFVDRKQYLSLFRERNIDGLLIWGAKDHEVFWNELSGYPHLFLGSVPSSYRNVNYLSSDYMDAGYLVARHLLDLGHRRLAWIGGKKTDVTLNRRFETGIKKALSEFDLAWDSLSVGYGDYRMDSGEKATRELLSSGRKFSAIISANYDMGEGVINVLRQNESELSGKVSVACCDACRDEDDGRLDMTRIEVRDLEIGESAALTICSLIHNPDGKTHKEFKVDFIIGRTTMPPVNGHRGIAGVKTVSSLKRMESPKSDMRHKNGLRINPISGLGGGWRQAGKRDGIFKQNYRED